MPEPVVDTTHPVLVTGATGYVAGPLIERLLSEGLTVHGTVRNPDKTQRLTALTDLAARLPGTLKFFAADLMQPGSFAEAMQGCSVVFHTASPFTTSVDDPQSQLVDPAVDGTTNVLQQANATPSVTRVVLTSSCAAIYGDNADLADTPDGVFTEAQWNTTSSLEHAPYSFSKTQAERAAWRIHDAQDRWRLVVVNPCLVMGPGIKVHESSESYSLLTQLGDGTMQSGVPDIGMGIVDVRDVAEGHVRAGFVPDASGRHILAGHDSSFAAIAEVLKPRFSDYRLPKRVAPKWLLWLVGPFVNAGITRRYVTRNVGLPWKSDNSKSIEALGVTYRPLETTMHEMFQQLVDAGALKKG